MKSSISLVADGATQSDLPYQGNLLQCLSSLSSSSYDEVTKSFQPLLTQNTVSPSLKRLQEELKAPARIASSYDYLFLLLFLYLI